MQIEFRTQSKLNKRPKPTSMTVPVRRCIMNLPVPTSLINNQTFQNVALNALNKVPILNLMFTQQFCQEMIV